MLNFGKKIGANRFTKYNPIIKNENNVQNNSKPAQGDKIEIKLNVDPNIFLKETLRIKTEKKDEDFWTDVDLNYLPDINFSGIDNTNNKNIDSKNKVFEDTEHGLDWHGFNSNIFAMNDTVKNDINSYHFKSNENILITTEEKPVEIITENIKNDKIIQKTRRSKRAKIDDGNNNNVARFGTDLFSNFPLKTEVKQNSQANDNGHENKNKENVFNSPTSYEFVKKLTEEMKTNKEGDYDCIHQDPQFVNKFRPVNAFNNRLPKEFMNCACKCGHKNEASEAPIRMKMIDFIRAKYLTFSSLLILQLPFDSNLSSMHLVSFGRFVEIGDNDGEKNIMIFDMEMEAFCCCPSEWMYLRYLFLISKNLIRLNDDVFKSILSQLIIRSQGFRFVVVPEYNLTLHTLSIAFRHDLGRAVDEKKMNDKKGGGHSNHYNKKTGGISHNGLRVKMEYDPNVTYSTPAEIRTKFAGYGITDLNKEADFDLSNLWQKTLINRISELEQRNKALQDSVAYLVLNNVNVFNAIEESSDNMSTISEKPLAERLAEVLNNFKNNK